MFGILVIYKGKKSNARLLFYIGLAITFGSLMWLANFVDFLTILFTGYNLNPTAILIANIMTWMWFAPAIIFNIIVFSGLLVPKIKKYVVFTSLIVGIFYEFIVFFDLINSITFVYPSVMGEDLIDEVINFNSLLGIMIFIYFSLMFVFLIGLLIKGTISVGVIRKKIFLIAIGLFLSVICALLDTFTFPGIVIIFIRSGVIVSFFFFYLGLREESAEHKKKSVKKKVKIEDGLFRLTKRPDQITEEEIIFHREKKICLVCKGKVSKLLYMCPECDALYCVKCSEALSEAENACWVCDAPIDESKPSKPYESVEAKEDISVETAEKRKKECELK